MFKTVINIVDRIIKLAEPRNQIQSTHRKRAQNPVVHGDSASKSLRRNYFSPASFCAGFDVHFHRQCYKTIRSCFKSWTIELWCTLDVWRALKKLELHSNITPRKCSVYGCNFQFQDILES